MTAESEREKTLIILIFVLVIAFLFHVVYLIFRNLKRDNQFNQNIVFHAGMVVGTGQPGDDFVLIDPIDDNTATLLRKAPGPLVTSSLAQIQIRLFDIVHMNYYDYLLRDALVIGRHMHGSTAEIQIDDSMVSGKHCKIYRQGEKLYIQDLGSTNHTYLNNCPVDTVMPLLYGDLIKIGRNTYQLQYFV